MYDRGVRVYKLLAALNRANIDSMDDVAKEVISILSQDEDILKIKGNKIVLSPPAYVVGIGLVVLEALEDYRSVLRAIASGVADRRTIPIITAGMMRKSMLFNFIESIEIDYLVDLVLEELLPKLRLSR